ncbi:MAG: hypothetical protein M1834_009688 [Cirrosporium novae-zelandiae]|nr:MAG: hypothetical protein M1834_009688 [Cirrosporium novae-zelandiae]
MSSPNFRSPSPIADDSIDLEMAAQMGFSTFGNRNQKAWPPIRQPAGSPPKKRDDENTPQRPGRAERARSRGQKRKRGTQDAEGEEVRSLALRPFEAGRRAWENTERDNIIGEGIIEDEDPGYIDSSEDEVEGQSAAIVNITGNRPEKARRLNPESDKDTSTQFQTPEYVNHKERDAQWEAEVAHAYYSPSFVEDPWQEFTHS